MLRRPHAAPEQFRALTGLSPEAFEALVRRSVPLYRLSEAARLGQRLRRRSAGAGRKFEHPFAERLAVQLVLRHARPTQKLLSRITGFTESTLSRDARRLAPLLPTLDAAGRLPCPPPPCARPANCWACCTVPISGGFMTRYWPDKMPRSLTLPRTSLAQNLQFSALKYPDKTALSFYDQLTSYASFLTAHAAWPRT